MTAHQGPSSLNNPPSPVDTQSISPSHKSPPYSEPRHDCRAISSSRSQLRSWQKPYGACRHSIRSYGRWRADALLLGETSAALQARHDAVTTLDDLEEQKRELAAGQAALAIERATFDAEKRAFADQAATLAGRLSVEWDRMEKLRADQTEEPSIHRPATQAIQANCQSQVWSSKAPPSPAQSPGAPSEDPTKELPGGDFPAPARISNRPSAQA